MSDWAVTPMPGLVESNVVPEIIIHGVGAVEIISESYARFFLYALQRIIEDPKAPPVPTVMAKIVQPLMGLPEDIEVLARCLGRYRAPGIVPIQASWTPQLVR